MVLKIYKLINYLIVNNLKISHLEKKILTRVNNFGLLNLKDKKFYLPIAKSSLKIVIFKFFVNLFRLSIMIIIVFLLNNFSTAEIKQRNFIHRQKRFIFELYKKNKFFDCVAETRRLLNYNKNINIKDDLLFFIDTCYYSGSQYKTVIAHFESKSIKQKLNLHEIFLVSQSYFNIGAYYRGVQILNTIKYSEITEQKRFELLRRKIELQIRSFNLEDAFAELKTASNNIDDIKNSLTIENMKNDFNKFQENGLKSKWLAVTLSAVIPGAGQIYSSRITDGIISFLSITGAAFAAYYSRSKDEKPLALTFAFFSCLFYGGNLYGAYNSAAQTNMNNNHQFTRQMMTKYNLRYNPMDYVDTGGIFE